MSTVITMPRRRPAPPPNTRECPECRGRGISYQSQGPHDPDVEPITCETCAGRGFVLLPPDDEAELDDPSECPACGRDDLRFVAIESREPHGERFRDEGWRCTNCGTFIMRQAEPIRSRTSEDILGDLLRSLVLAKNLDPAFRLGIALSIPRKPAGRVDGQGAEKGAA
jgi:hypothetical protein